MGSAEKLADTLAVTVMLWRQEPSKVFAILRKRVLPGLSFWPSSPKVAALEGRRGVNWLRKSVWWDLTKVLMQLPLKLQQHAASTHGQVSALRSFSGVTCERCCIAWGIRMLGQFFKAQ